MEREATSPAVPNAGPRPRWQRRYLFAAIGVAVAAVLFFLGPFPASNIELRAMAAIATLMAVFWVFEVVPIAVTALFPLFLFPFFGIADLKRVSASYGKPTIFLFLGGFLLALGIQRCGLHRRIALRIVATIGSRPANLVLGFMLSSAFLSMWISNTASVMVMLPIALAVLGEAEGSPRADLVPALGTALMLGIAYAADIGGMATPVGTPPNLAFIDIQGEIFPDSPTVAFADWMVMGLPLAVTFLGSGWLVLTRKLYPMPRESVFGRSEVIREQLRALGPIRQDEALTGIVFLCTALLWMTGSGIGDLPGWREHLGLGAFGDGAVAIFGAVILFLVPSQDRRGETLMDWKTAEKVPWDILLLFGGGFALAAGFELSGLSAYIGTAMTHLQELPVWLMVIIVCTVLTFLTELTSNTATANLVLPILGRASVSLGLDPRTLMIPATLSASCAFMMPVASPTQAIIFGSGYVTIRQMVRAGIWFNLLGIALVTLIFFAIGAPVMDIEPGVVPSWAR